VAIIGVMIT